MASNDSGKLAEPYIPITEVGGPVIRSEHPLTYI
jgi:hypothetical protein